MAERRLNIPIIVKEQGSEVLDKLGRDFENLRNQVEANNKSAERWQRGITSLRGQLLALVGALGVGSIVAFGKRIVETTDQFKMMQKSLDSLTEGKGEEWFQALNKWALQMPISTEQAIDAFRSLKAQGLEPTIDDLTTILDTTYALGTGTKTIDTIAQALGKIQQEGQLTTRALTQLRDAGIPVFDILREKLGLTTTQIYDLRNQHVDASRAITAILEGLKERYGGFSDKVQQSYGGMTDTIKKYTTEFIRMIGDQGGVLKATEDVLSEYTQNMREAFDEGTAEQWATIIGDVLSFAIRTLAQVGIGAADAAGGIADVATEYENLLEIIADTPERAANAAGLTVDKTEQEMGRLRKLLKDYELDVTKAIGVPIKVGAGIAETAITALGKAWESGSFYGPRWIQILKDSREEALLSSESYNLASAGIIRMTEAQKQSRLEMIRHRQFMREMTAKERETGEPYSMARGGPPSHEIGPPRILFEREEEREKEKKTARRLAAEREAILEEMEKLRKDMDDLTGKTVTEQLAYWTKYEQEKLAILHRLGLADANEADLSRYVQEQKTKLLDTALKGQKANYEQFLDFRAGMTEDLKRFAQGETQFEIGQIQRRASEREKDLQEWVRTAKEQSEEVKKIIASAYGGTAGRDAERFVSTIQTIERITNEMKGATEERREILQVELNDAQTVYKEIEQKYLESQDKQVRAVWKSLDEKVKIMSLESTLQSQSFQTTLMDMGRFQDRMAETIQGKQKESLNEVNRIIMDQFEYQRWAAEESYQDRLNSISKERESWRAIYQESSSTLESLTGKTDQESKKQIAIAQHKYNMAVNSLEELDTLESLYHAQRKARIDEITKEEQEANLLRQQSTEEYLEWHLQKLAEQGASIRELEEARIDWMIDNNERFFEGMRLGFKKVEWAWSDWGKRGADASQTLASAISSSMSQAFSNIIMGTESVDEAFARMGEAIIRTIMDIIAQLLVEWMILQMIKGAGAIAGLFGSGLQLAGPGAVGAGVGGGAGVGAGIGGGPVGGGIRPPIVGHAGGIIGETSPVYRHFHQGGVAGAVRIMPDEIPAILQKGEAVIPRDSTRRNRDLVNYLLDPWKRIRDTKGAIAEIRTIKGQAQYGYGSMTRDAFEKTRAADELVRVVSSPVLKEEYRPEDALPGGPGFDLSTGRKHEGAEQESKVGKISRLLQPEIGGAFGGMGNITMASLGAMMAAQQEPIGGERRREDPGEPAQVTVNLINQTGTQFRARAGETRYDGKKQIQDVILESLFTNPEFRQSARKGLGVR